MSNERFHVAGTHIFDSEDDEWIPQAGTYIAAKLIAEKLNELNSKNENNKKGQKTRRKEV